MARESEIWISLVQDVELLPSGYQEEHHATLVLLEERFEIVTEMLGGLLDNGMTTSLEGDDEEEGDAQYLPATDIFPATIRVSSPDFGMPDIRDEVLVLIQEGLGEVVERLPHLLLEIQFPLDE